MKKSVNFASKNLVADKKISAQQNANLDILKELVQIHTAVRLMGLSCATVRRMISAENADGIPK